jgi:cell division protein FtsI (penicillin-binding protein 3)
MGALKREVIPWRLYSVWLGMLFLLLLLVLRAIDLQFLERDFLQGQGDARQVRTVLEPAYRGVILDRNGEPLAISGPVDSVWAHPGELLAHLPAEGWPVLAQALGISEQSLRERVASRAAREFVYLQRHLPPEQAQRVMDLEIPGVALLREFKRYYPHGEVASHVVGFTDIDERGQDGAEKTFDGWLAGHSGQKRVLRDRHGQRIRDIEQVRAAQDGHSLRLTIDHRLQYLAYRELKAAVELHQARTGSALLIDAHTGDILAMVSQPGFNPNHRGWTDIGQTRNRAAADTFEPGSVIKPFTVAAALDSGTIRPDWRMNTSPGHMRVGRHLVRDIRNLGQVDLNILMARSSNVASSRLALDTPPAEFWGLLQRAGFGRSNGTNIPGEANGLLRDFQQWREIERATLGFGYGLSVTPLQLGTAYTAFANAGVRMPLRLVETANDPREPERVMRPETAALVLELMERVTSQAGTAQKAAIPGYRVAGKTGTSRKLGPQGYATDRYLATFVGIAPVSNPRFVMVVVIDEPSSGQFYGGAVAAPVFATVVEAALRLFEIPPDAHQDRRVQVALHRGVAPP